MDYKRLLLDRLLDKFERSKAYLDADSARRRVMIRLCSGEFPEYDIENPESRELINSVVDDLAQKGVVGYGWLRHETGNIVDKVWLILENIDSAYKEADRTSKSSKAEGVLAVMREYREKAALPWICRFLDDAMINIEDWKSLSPFLPEDVKSAEAVIKALAAIDARNEDEYLERVFSLKCFGDSKYFERYVRKRLTDVVRKYYLKDGCESEGYGDDEVLSQVGIVKAPEQIDFCGGVICTLNGSRVDFSVFSHGISINSLTSRELEITGLSSVDKILFIENKANYVDYIRREKRGNELVIFHGGFYSPPKGLFFKKIYDAGIGSGAQFYHWGDIDVGGFRIFNRLKTEIIPCLKPLRMDRDAFYSKRDYWSVFDKRYGLALKKLREDDSYREFHEVIDSMLAENARLEQEAFI